MIDLIQEIFGTIKRNKLRTFLTGFAVAWGIFMLIVLLGAGNGLIHAFESSSADMAMNSIKVFPGIIRKSKFPQNPKRSVRFSGKGTKRSVQKRKARNTQKAETKVL